MKPLARNLVDRAWGRERPIPPAAAIVLHPPEHAGRSAAEKIADVQAKLATDGQDAVILTLPDSICWLFNIRGADVAHNPVALAFAIVPAKGKPELFIAPEKLTPEVRAHLGRGEAVTARGAEGAHRGAARSEKRVRLDPETAAHWFVRALGGKERVVRGPDPCLALKARKNAAEIAGARAAHLRDGAAMVRFLAWLDREARAARSTRSRP